MNAVRAAMSLMKLRESVPPSPDIVVGELSEVFTHPIFLDGTAETRQAIMLQSSESKYQSELTYPWDNYFDCDLGPLLRGATALDLGSFTGGRTVAWFERYCLQKVVGIDVDPVYVEAATQYARSKGCNAEFYLAKGEGLPFPDASFDAVLSFDVFEHVQSVGRTLDEVFRVLRPGGRLLLVFPGYYQPVEHHLGLVTETPGLQYLFSGSTLVEAYVRILEERGAAADWYARRSSTLEPWERGHTINGTTYGSFRRLISQRWKVVHHSRKPLGSIGRNATRSLAIRTISGLLHPLVFVPGLREIALHRITYVLERPDRAAP